MLKRLTYRDTDIPRELSRASTFHVVADIANALASTE